MFAFQMEKYGELNEYNFIGPLDIITSAGGLFAFLELFVVLLLSATTAKYYNINVIKHIK